MNLVVHVALHYSQLCSCLSAFSWSQKSKSFCTAHRHRRA